jgi:hypothetical protein
MAKFLHASSTRFLQYIFGPLRFHKNTQFQAKYRYLGDIIMESTFFMNSANKAHKTPKTDESEARDLELKTLKFVEFEFKFPPNKVPLRRIPHT